MSLSLYFSVYILEIKLRSFTFQSSSLFLNCTQNIFLNVGFETESSWINRVGLEHTLHLSWPRTYDPHASVSQMHVLTEMHQQFLLLCMPEAKIKANVMTAWLQIPPTTNLVLRTMRCVYGLLVERTLLI